MQEEVMGHSCHLKKKTDLACMNATREAVKLRLSSSIIESYASALIDL